MITSEFNKNTIYGYYVVEQLKVVERIRLNDSSKHNEMFEWCQNNCVGKYNCMFIYAHHRPDGEPYVDAWTWEFENIQDAQNFKAIYGN